MKNQFFHLCTLSAVLFTLSCSKSNHETTAKSNSSEPPVELKVKWTPGKRIVQRMALTTTTGMAAGKDAQPREQTMEMGMDYSLNPLKQTDTGGAEVELEFVSAKLESRMGDRVLMSFDSAHDDGKDTKRDFFIPALRKMIGGKLRYVLDANGKLERLDGYDQFVVRVAQGSRNPQMFKGIFSEEMMKRFCNWSDALPDHPIRPGDKWKYSVEVNPYGMFKMSIDGKFTFKNWEDRDGHKCVRLDYDGTITGKGDGKAQVSIEKGKIHGSSWFDPEQGVAVGSDSDQTVTLKIKQKANTITQQVRQNVTMQLVE